MIDFNIEAFSKSLKGQLIDKINNKTKPPGSLGLLEHTAVQAGLIQNTLTPSIKNPFIITFAGDHGIAQTGKVNPFPQEVTAQMVHNFLNGGAAINVFCKQNNIKQRFVNAGVNADFKFHPDLINACIRKGTRNYLEEPAMTMDETVAAINKGSEVVNKAYNEGCNTIGFGEMGIGNTSSAALLMSFFTKLQPEDCTGKGTGSNDEQLKTKIDTLQKVYNKHYHKDMTALEALACFGGYEIAMMAGAFCQAASLKMITVVDGFIATAALSVAYQINPLIIQYCVFAHQSEENGHAMFLQTFNVQPLLNLNMRLGEGTGAALAIPLIQSSINMLNSMASFDDAGVSEKAD